MLLGDGQFLDKVGNESRPLAFGFCTIMMLYLVGMADDLIGIRYRAKFAIQIICGVLVIAGGLWINDLHGLLFIHTLPEWIGYPITLFAVVFIINADQSIIWDRRISFRVVWSGYAFLWIGVFYNRRIHLCPARFCDTWSARPLFLL